MTDDYTVVPLSPMRKIIATRMTQAKQTIPHFRLGADIQLDAILGLRQRLQEKSPQQKLSINDLLTKAAASALVDSPDINIQWVDGAIHQYRWADISVIVSIAGGLAAPIIRKANTKSVWEISHEVKELAERAAKNGLKMSDILGGTFSVSNLGMYGVDEFDAIINPPQCAILAVARAKRSFIFCDDHEPRIAMVTRMTLSVDHRAIDGATAARFLGTLKHRVENPEPLHFDS